jgi:hypothetical protein
LVLKLNSVVSENEPRGKDKKQNKKAIKMENEERE